MVIKVIIMNIQNLLDEREKTRYWLVKEMQTTYRTVNKLCDNTLTGLQLDTIEKLCDILECSPGDLFVMKYIRKTLVRLYTRVNFYGIVKLNWSLSG